MYEIDLKETKTGPYSVEDILHRYNADIDDYDLKNVCTSACIFDIKVTKEFPTVNENKYSKSQNFPKIAKKELKKALEVA